MASGLRRALWAPGAIRERCAQVFERALDDRLIAYRYHPERLPATADYVLGVMAENYPHGDIPPHSRWRHFEAGGVDRWAALEAGLATPAERARAATELTIVSVLLDAGAGAAWRYVEAPGSASLQRSEGLGVASLAMYRDGAFSSRPNAPHRVDTAGLLDLGEAAFERAFQVGPDNPLIGAPARVALLNGLGGALRARGVERLGDLVEELAPGGEAHMGEAFPRLLALLAPIWPARAGGHDLGDVFPYPGIAGAPGSQDLVPFHKLTQWMCYSLAEAWRRTGIAVHGEELLTALPEYRNGGLLLDLGVLVPRDPARFAAGRFEPASPEVVEMRALTVALVDRLAALLRERLGRDERSLSLAQVLEGGTWSAGRKIAREKRRDGGPPIDYVADGTLF